MIRRAVALVLCLALLSCAQSPPQQEVEFPFDVPEDWTSEPLGNGEVSERWWEEFQVPELDTLIAEALRNNPSLAAVGSRVDQALAQAVIAGADAYPIVDAGFGASRQQTQFFAPGQGPRTNRFNLHSLSLNIGWELDVWGRIRAGHEAAIADAQAREAAFYGAQLSLMGAVVKSYFLVTESRLQAKNAEDNLLSVSSLAAQVEARYNRGLRTALDLRLTLAEVAASESAFERRGRELNANIRQLEILLGRYPTGQLAAGEGLPAEMGPLPAGLPATLLERRPDLVQAERELASQERLLEEAKANLLPRIALTASGGTVAEELENVLNRNFGVWSIAGNLVQPLFAGGRLLANVDQNEAGHLEAIALYVDQVLFAFSEVEIALTSEGFFVGQEESLVRAVRESEAGLDISQERYLTGVMDILDVLEARRRFFEAQGALISVQRQKLANRVDLYLALGGGFQGLETGTEQEEQ